MNKHDAPVPKVVLSSTDYVVLEDAGTSVKQCIKNSSVSERTHLLYKAGEALGTLHSLNFAHGRPFIRDMCWDGSRITLVDFERHKGQFASKRQQAQDILIFVHGLFMHVPNFEEGVNAALKGYLSTAGNEAFASAVKFAAFLNSGRPVLEYLAKVGGRDLRLVLPVLDILLEFDQIMSVNDSIEVGA